MQTNWKTIPYDLSIDFQPPTEDLDLSNYFEKVKFLADKRLLTEKYKLNKYIGFGAFSTVLEAQHRITKKFVAIKKLNNPVANYKALYKEINIMTQIKHPNLVQYISTYYLEPENFWIVMEYLAGGTLYGLLGRAILSECQIASVAKDVLNGLHYLHSKV